jgi:hypothetical protein
VLLLCDGDAGRALIPVPGGLGYEGTLEERATVLGNGMATSTSAMILVRFATLWFAVLVGFVALALLRLRYPRPGPRGSADKRSPRVSSRVTRAARVGPQPANTGPQERVPFPARRAARSGVENRPEGVRTQSLTAHRVD